MDYKFLLLALVPMIIFLFLMLLAVFFTYKVTIGKDLKRVAKLYEQHKIASTANKNLKGQSSKQSV